MQGVDWSEMFRTYCFKTYVFCLFWFLEGGGGVERGVTSILIDKGKVMTKVNERESSAKNTSPD